MTTDRVRADGGPDRRRQRSERTREALEAAALELVARHGFEGTTIEDIASAAGVSSRTFFRHFETKEDVLLGDQEELRTRLRSSLDRRPPEEPILAGVREAVLSLAGDHEANRAALLQRAALVQSAPSVRARSAEEGRAWEELLSDWVAQRLGTDLNGDLRPALVAGAAMAALRAARTHWLANADTSSLPQLVEEALSLLDDEFGLADC